MPGAANNRSESERTKHRDEVPGYKTQMDDRTSDARPNQHREACDWWQRWGVRGQKAHATARTRRPGRAKPGSGPDATAGRFRPSLTPGHERFRPKRFNAGRSATGVVAWMGICNSSVPPSYCSLLDCPVHFLFLMSRTFFSVSRFQAQLVFELC